MWILLLPKIPQDPESIASLGYKNIKAWKNNRSFIDDYHMKYFLDRSEAIKRQEEAMSMLESSLKGFLTANPQFALEIKGISYSIHDLDTADLRPLMPIARVNIWNIKPYEEARSNTIES